MSRPKKRSPTEIIESTPRPEIEHSFRKFTGEEIIENTDYERGDETSSRQFNTIFSINKYTDIHTHPTAISLPALFGLKGKIFRKKPFSYPIIDMDSAMPSYLDFENFFKKNKQKTMVVSVREPRTGIVRGYTFVSKTNKTPKWDYIKPKDKRLDRLYLKWGSGNEFENFTKKYNLHYRFVPVKGYRLDEAGTQFVKIDDSNLEKKILTSVFGMFAVAGLFFSFSNFTGAAIGFSKSISFPAGIALFVIGILGLFFGRKLK